MVIVALGLVTQACSSQDAQILRVSKMTPAKSYLFLGTGGYT